MRAVDRSSDHPRPGAGHGPADRGSIDAPAGRTRSRSGIAGLLGVLLAALLVPVLAPSAAGAAGYTVWSCRDGDGTPVSSAAWRGGGTAGIRSDSCASGGSLRADLAQADGGASAASGFWFLAPTGAVIEHYRVWMRAAVSATSDASSYAAGIAEADGLAADALSDGCLAAPGGCTWGTTANPLDPGNLAEDSGTFPGLAVSVRCTTGSGCNPTADPAGSVELFSSAVDIQDDDAPVVGALVGTLFDSATDPGRRSVLAPLADVGGGVARTELLVDGDVVQTVESGGSCVVPFAVATPCPTRTDRGFVLDTATLASGVHHASVRATDAAGNVTVGADQAFVVEVPVIAPPVVPPVTPPPAEPGPVAVPVQRALRLQLASQVSLPEKGRTSGVVRHADGSPAAGVSLDVYAAPLGAAAGALTWLNRVESGADGRFVLPRSRESRTLRIVPADAADVASAVDVDLVESLAVRVTGPKAAVRNGRSVTLRGTITGAGDAVGDLPVLVQAIVNGRWSTIDDVTPTDAGRIVWTYRFKRTVRRSAYRFRMVVPKVRSMPWRKTVSPQRIVRVLPRTTGR